LTVGDPVVLQRKLIPALTANTEFEYTCPEECTRQFPGPLNVFGTFQHMHQVGKEIWTRHWRNTTIDEGITNKIEYWDNNFQAITNINFTLLPGDRLNTHCIYDTSGLNTTVKFGVATTDEMCMDFLFYYPLYPSVLYCGYGGSSNNGNTRTVCMDDEIQINNPNIPDPKGEENRSFGIVDTRVCPAVSSSSPNVGLIVGLSVIAIVVVVIVAVVCTRRKRQDTYSHIDS